MRQGGDKNSGRESRTLNGRHRGGTQMPKSRHARFSAVSQVHPPNPNCFAERRQPPTTDFPPLTIQLTGSSLLSVHLNSTQHPVISALFVPRHVVRGAVEGCSSGFQSWACHLNSVDYHLH